MIDALGSIVGEQLLNNYFRLLVFAFAELMMPNMPARVDKI